MEHAVGREAGSEQLKPAGHSEQAEEPAKLYWLVRSPEEHGVFVAVPSHEEPAGHGRHVSASMYYPGEHVTASAKLMEQNRPLSLIRIDLNY